MTIPSEIKTLVVNVAKSNYSRNGFFNSVEFKRDISMFFIVRKLIKRFVNTNIINENLVKNNIIILINVFGHTTVDFIFTNILSKEEYIILINYIIKPSSCQ